MVLVSRRRRTSQQHSFKASAQGGYTLVEVMVAMLITAIMVTSVFSVALTVKTGGNKGASKLRAGAMTRQVAAILKNYVTAELGNASTVTIPGPCAGAVNNWSMTCNGIIDTCPAPGGNDCYALAPGTHTLSGVNTVFEATPWFAQTKYHVQVNVVNGMPMPAVSITTTWIEP